MQELGATDDQFLKLYNYAGGKGQQVPCIHMPRWASRITLEITAVKVERVQDISEADAAAEMESHDDEGVTYYGPFGKGHASAREMFKSIWLEINGRESWDANPWVWCISFKRLEVANA